MAERSGLGRRIWWTVAVCGLVVLIGAVIWLAAPTVWVQASAPLGAVTAVLGAAVGLCVWAVVTAAKRRGERSAALVARTREEATAARRRFLARLDHELKNPVTVVRTLAAQHDVDGQPDRDDWEVVGAQSTRMARLVGDLRGLAELETAPLEVEQVHPDQLVQEALDDLAHEPLGVHLEHRVVQMHLPTAPWPLPVCQGDPDLLRLAIANLIGNAVKYSDSGDRVEIRGTEADGWVVIEVADTGRGIPADEVGQVLEELGRASNALDRPGSGVGLAMVNVIAQRHGGHVNVRSRLGEGTSVRLVLPVAG